MPAGIPRPLTLELMEEDHSEMQDTGPVQPDATEETEGRTIFEMSVAAAPHQHLDYSITLIPYAKKMSELVKTVTLGPHTVDPSIRPGARFSNSGMITFSKASVLSNFTAPMIVH
jgi:hypothetical protein